MAKQAPEPRKGMPPVELDEAAFLERFKAQYSDPAFDKIAGELDAVARTAWDGYSNSRKRGQGGDRPGAGRT